MLGYSSCMYDPSVMATSVPSAIDWCIHNSPPVIVKCSHSHVIPHNINNSLNVDGVLARVAIVATDVRRKCTPSSVCSTKHT
jgi:hypothetical protein